MTRPCPYCRTVLTGEIIIQCPGFGSLVAMTKDRNRVATYLHLKWSKPIRYKPGQKYHREVYQ